MSYANEEYLTEATITYEDDGVVGNRRNPFLVAFTHDTPTALNAAEADNGSYGWTDLSGRRLAKSTAGRRSVHQDKGRQERKDRDKTTQMTDRLKL